MAAGAACLVNWATAVTTASVRTRFKSGVGRLALGAAQAVKRITAMATKMTNLPDFLNIQPPILSIAILSVWKLGGIVNEFFAIVKSAF
jgi:hypothetical protein